MTHRRTSNQSNTLTAKPTLKVLLSLHHCAAVSISLILMLNSIDKDMRSGDCAAVKWCSSHSFAARVMRKGVRVCACNRISSQASVCEWGDIILMLPDVVLHQFHIKGKQSGETAKYKLLKQRNKTPQERDARPSAHTCAIYASSDCTRHRSDDQRFQLCTSCWLKPFHTSW